MASQYLVSTISPNMLCVSLSPSDKENACENAGVRVRSAPSGRPRRVLGERTNNVFMLAANQATKQSKLGEKRSGGLADEVRILPVFPGWETFILHSRMSTPPFSASQESVSNS